MVPQHRNHPPFAPFPKLRAAFTGRFRMSISTLFSVVLALIVLVSVGTILLISTVTARVGLVQDLAEDFDFVIATIDDRVSDHLSSVEAQLAFLDDLIADDPTILDDDQRLALTLRTSIAAAPQVTAIALVRPDTSSVRFESGEGRVFTDDLTERADVRRTLGDAERRGPQGAPMGWSEPLFSPNIGRTIIVRREAIWIDGAFVGLLLAGVDLFALSRYAADVSSTIGQTIFILHGRDRIIAHPGLIEGKVDLSLDRPLASIDEMGDPRLESMWREDRRPVISQARMQRSEGHYFRADGEWQVFVYAETDAYGSTPWLIGFHFDTSTEGTEVRRFWVVLAIGLCLLVVFTGLGVWFGRRLSRPFQVLTDNASALQRLDFDTLKPMGGSRIVELDRTASAFDAMVRGLRVFERYVPRRVVERIIGEGKSGIEPDERAVTVLFIDIAGFSQIAESMSPQQTAALLNDHFQRIGAAIEAQAGTIDKYVGDGLLAFWGAPDRQDDHACRACRAALAIRDSIEAENRSRSAESSISIRARIGIHTGSAIVGDIGASSRINYTVIGDAVNIASRVESEGRHHMRGDVTILITEDTLEAARPDFSTETIGPTQLRGRSQPIVLHLLFGEAGGDGA